MVQASHACIESAKQMNADCQPYLVVIGVKSERKLIELSKRVGEICGVFAFYEPDMNNEMTAFATEPVTGDLKHNFQKYQLLQ